VSTTEDPVIEELLQFIYLMPLGVIKFGADGGVELMNPMASQMLLPLVAEMSLDNLFQAMRSLCPELGDAVGAFQGESGSILDQRRIDACVGHRHVTLSLTVTRVNRTTHMAVLRDISRLTEMLAFAFTSADLLIEVDNDSRITWAGGAFQSLLGMQPKDAIGNPLDSLFSPRDRDTLNNAMLGIGSRGRLLPQLLRLTNPAQTRCVLAGLALRGNSERFFVTVGPPPAAVLKAEVALKGSHEFLQEAETWLRNRQDGVLGLLDVHGWEKAATKLNNTQLDCLKREIGRLAETAGGDAIALGEISAGRFGVLAPANTDLSQLARALEELVGSFSPGREMAVVGTQLDLGSAGLSPSQSIQAIRLVLSRFGMAGASGAEGTGLADGLLGVIRQASTQKRVLANIIEGGHFMLAYQPIVGLADRAVHHYEALIRPTADPANPATNPQEFVTLVEAVGLSLDLDLAVLRRGLEALRQGVRSVAVNVSGHSIGDPAFARAVEAGVRGLAAGRLLVEVTETAEIQDMAAAAGQIERIRAAGVPVCLDDFGAGSASFRYLRELRVDFIKIDGSYVREASRNDQGRSFVSAMRDLAASTGAETIAEMIETEADAALMRKLGISLGQGWLFGKPGPLPVAKAKAQSKPAREWR
jgi:EAL domain-containing protein (putative c-di-GMP-specific phosphodiesterase class I)